MDRYAVRLLITVGILAVSLSAPWADTAVDAYRAMGIATKDVLSGTCLNAKVMQGDDKQLVCVTTYMNGKRLQPDAVAVRLDVFSIGQGRLTSTYTRDFGSEQGSPVSDGNLEVIDLDVDGVNEIIVSYDSFANPLIEVELAEIIVHDGEFRTAWSGPLVYDATRAARDIPVERRDRFRRELDLVNTLRSRGLTLFFNKHMIAVAGERLAEPKTVRETFPLRPQAGS